MKTLIDKVWKTLKLAVVATLCLSCGDPTLFESIPASNSGVYFSNDIVETLDLNIEQSLFMYNGGGVAIGDINNDGLPDIYFSANQKPDKLYVNQGDMKFKDATESSGMQSTDHSWTTGVTMTDVNGDGWLDIYICQLHGINGWLGSNKLYVNNTNGTFTERAKEFGLDARTYAQHAAFFDFDLDGDLDMYLLNLGLNTSGLNAHEKLDTLAKDRLYENRSGFFTDIRLDVRNHSKNPGYGLSVGIGDINNDNYPDIFIANDFNEPDYLYKNNKDGTFLEISGRSLGHMSFSSHGNDIADINNDGLLDIFTLDRNSNNEVVAKMSLSSDDYGEYPVGMQQGYYDQFQRNMLQINCGDILGDVVRFSEQGEFSGVSATDWSWSSLFADFDLDGNKDLFVTNGIPHRPMNLDFLQFKSGQIQDSLALNQLELIARMPRGEIANAMFKNTGGKFENVSKDWGLDLVACSNGAAYADLDNDGDLDLVLNNLNAKASIFENKANEHVNRNYLKVKFEGSPDNKPGIGSRVTLYTSGEQQTQELFPVKGWLSSVDNILFFGLGNSEIIDSLHVNWKDGMGQLLTNISSNQMLTVKYADASEMIFVPKTTGQKRFFEIGVEQSGIDFHHEENDFSDFDYEKLLPRMLSRQGPKMAVGDVNNDGLEDFYIGGAKNQAGKIYAQHLAQDKIFKELENEVFFRDRIYEDAGSVFVDVDLDGDVDLYVVSGGGEPFKDFTLTDRLYLNDGSGHFSKSSQHPQLAFNGSCAVVGDLNQDGVKDIFVGGRSIPGSYGKYPRSRILLGDGEGRLYDATARAFGDKINLGMVTDAVWLEGSKELIVVGDWMPITILSFRDEKIEEKKLPNTTGWWNAIFASDMDGDGDKDLFVGNRGLNCNLKSSPKFPVNLYIKDFDNNGIVDPILTHYCEAVEYVYFGLDKMAQQLAAMKKAFPTYESYARSTFHEVFPEEELVGAGRWQAHIFASMFLENQGPGNFVFTVLPDELQMAPIYGFASCHIDEDSVQNVFAVGNDYGTQPNIGKLDASYGHVIHRKDKEPWTPFEPRFSGFAVDGEARDIKVVKDAEGNTMILVSRNNDDIILLGVNPGIAVH